MILSLLLLFAGFILLIKGADFMVKGAASLARKFNISELAIGLTIVAFGTSAPELVVSVVSSLDGYNEVVYGNVIGSNIFNLYLILGICGLIYPLTVQRQTVWREIPYSLLAVLVLFFLLNDGLFWGNEDILSRIDAFILTVFFLTFLTYIFFNLKNEATAVQPGAKTYKGYIMLLMIAGGLAGLVIGGKMVVDNAITIARTFDLSEKLIGLTIIAAGTSLPELATSAVAAYRRSSDIAIGNIIGSNIFNIFFILAVSGFISPMPYDDLLNMDLYILMLGTVLLFLAMFSGKGIKLERWEAAILLAGYFAYIYYLIMRE